MASPHDGPQSTFHRASLVGQIMNPIRARCLAAVCAAALLALAGSGTADDNVLGLPKLAVRNKGSLVICGGGDIPDAVYERFVELAGGASARLVLIPTAYPFETPGEAEDNYHDWRSRPVAAFDFLDAATR